MQTKKLACYTVTIDDLAKVHVTAKKISPQTNTTSQLVLTAEKCNTLLGKSGVLTMYENNKYTSFSIKIPFKDHVKEGYREKTIELPSEHLAQVSTRQQITLQAATFVGFQSDEKRKEHFSTLIQTILEIQTCLNNNVHVSRHFSDLKKNV